MVNKVRQAVAVLLFLSLFLSVSCTKALRGEGPPETLAGTVWIGTNEARGEILEFSFGTDMDSFTLGDDGSSVETGEVKLLFTSPVNGEQELRDTVSYSGHYSYSRWPSSLKGDVYHGDVSFTLTDPETGAARQAGMTFHNMRFYFVFRDSSGAWPTDLAEDSWVNSGQ